MSKVKKVFAIILSMAMILGMSLTAFATPVNVTDITSDIIVEGLSADVKTEVKLYRFATLQYNSENNEYSWSIAAWADEYVKLNNSKTAYEIVSGEEDSLKDAASKQSADYSKVEDNAVLETSCTFEDVIIGGYVIIPSDTNADYEPLFVTNTYDRDNSPNNQGRPVAIDVTVYAKSENHTITKSQSDSFAQIGQMVNYEIRATFPMSENTEGEQLNQFEITDIPTGLKINQESVKVELAGSDITTQVSVNVDSTSGVLTVDFDNILSGGHDGKAIVITYEAMVVDTEYNNNAGATSNTTDYSSGTVNGDTGSIEITKIDVESEEELTGAQFQVYDLGVDGVWNAQGENVPMQFIYDEEKDVYRPALSTDKEDDKVTKVEVDANGILKIVGLDEGNYHFEEVVAPDGYSINELGLTVTVANEDGKRDVQDNFEDTKLSALPSTGGIGTTIFTVGGCAIMIVAAGLYFASRRKQENK